jgi:hypothetical protein
LLSFVSMNHFFFRFFWIQGLSIGLFWTPLLVILSSRLPLRVLHVMKTCQGRKIQVPMHSRPLYEILRKRSSFVPPACLLHFYFAQDSASLSLSLSLPPTPTSTLRLTDRSV